VAHRLAGPRRTEKGIALVAVLWVLALLGVIAAAFLRETSIETRLTRNLVENAKAEALADAGVQRAVLGLLDPDETRAWRADGTLYQFTLGEGVVWIRLQDEAGKIDLNRAPDQLLLALFRAVGLQVNDAASLVDAIADFRDRDNERRPAGAEDPDYVAAGLPDGAKDAPFEVADELLQVLGVDRDLYERIAPNLTVYSARRQVDRAVAPAAVLRVLPDITPTEVDEILSTRRAGTKITLPQPDTVTVTSEASTASGGAFIRRAVLQRTGNPTQPFQVLEWRQRWHTMAVSEAESAMH
jgi:general secretion pathway protein K